MSLPSVLLLSMTLISPMIAMTATENYWEVRAIDTMKYSRDRARESSIVSEIPKIVTAAADLNPTHIAIGTPYDSEFNRVNQSWAREIHRRKINVWFRGNFSGWEGWFDYEELSSPEDHHTKTYQFITSNPDFFRDGDIFTPAPEPENGLIGDPRFGNKEAYYTFLRTSYQTCVDAFEAIDKDVTCGYFGTNGDIAKDILTPELVADLGNVIIIDHYVKDADIFAKDIDFLANKFPNAKIIIGEFGAPVPDIHGSMTNQEQASIIDDFLKVMYVKQAIVTGVNYWVLNEGTTAIVTDNLEPKLAYDVLYKYYNPQVITGIVRDTLDDPISKATINFSDDHRSIQTDSQGRFTASIPADSVEIEIIQDNYFPGKQVLTLDNSTEIVEVNLTPKKPTFLYKVRLLLKSILSGFPRS